MVDRAGELRGLMRSFPSGVAVVTVDVEGERLGLTIGTVVTLSLEPPLVGISVSRQAALHELLRRAGAFALSLLGDEQAALAQHFARGVPPIGLWAGVATRGRPGEAPVLEGALGWLRCRLWGEYPTGDHTFFVGEIGEVARGPAAAPLVYVEQEFRSL